MRRPCRTSASSSSTSSSQDKSAREALQTFLARQGDVLLAYENEAIFANQNSQEARLRDPEGDDPDREPDRRHDDVAEQADGERVPPLPPHDRRRRRSSRRTATARSAGAREGIQFPVRPQLFTIKWLGGWAKVDNQFFDPNSGIVTKIQREVGELSTHAASPSRPAAIARPGAVVTQGLVDGVPDADRPAAALGARLAVDGGRAELLGRRHRPAGRGGAEADAGGLASSSRS